MPYENRPGSYHYFITRGLGAPIRVSRFFSKEINRFSNAMVLTNLIIVSFFNWFSQPGYQNYEFFKNLKNTLVIGKNGKLVKLIIKKIFFK